MAMEKYLIALDLDGTLLPDLYSLSDYSVKVFKELSKRGHKIVITTGRPYRSSGFVYDAFKLDTPIINYNGCLITNPSNNREIIDCHEIKREDILDIYNHCKGQYTLFFVEHFDDIYSNLDGADYRKLMHYRDGFKLNIGDLNKTLDTDIHGSLILGDGVENTKKMVDYINSGKFENLGARVWGWDQFSNIIELFAYKPTKGDALTKVMDILGFDKAHTIACGDSQNDYEFFRDAGITVCLSNADPGIKKIATHVYPVECWDSGIAKFFNDYFKLGL